MMKFNVKSNFFNIRNKVLKSIYWSIYIRVYIIIIYIIIIYILLIYTINKKLNF